MIVRIRLAVKTLNPVVSAAPKIGMKPNVLCSKGSMCSCTKGARTSRPQKPRMTLGIAASISTSGEIDAADPGRRQQAQVEADRDRDRRAQRQRHERGDEGAEEERAGAEFVEVRLPGRVGEEAEPELRDRRHRAVHDLVADQDDHRYRHQRGEEADPVEQPVADPVALSCGASASGRRGRFRSGRGVAVVLIGRASVEERKPFLTQPERIFTELTQVRNKSQLCYIF